MNNLKSVEKTFLSIMEGIERIPDKNTEGNVFWCKNDEILFYEDRKFNVFALSYDAEKIFEAKNCIKFSGGYPKYSVLELYRFDTIIRTLLKKHFDVKVFNIETSAHNKEHNRLFYSGWKNINCWVNRRNVSIKDCFKNLTPSNIENIYTFAKQTVHYKEGMTISHAITTHPEKKHLIYEISFKDNENEVIKNYTTVGGMVVPESYMDIE